MPTPPAILPPLVPMKSLPSTTTNIRKPHSASSFVSNKQKPTRGIQPLRSSRALTSAVTDHITQTLVRDLKKLLELEVLMNHPCPSMNEQEMIIEKCWLESQKELGSSRERTKAVDQQVCYIVTLVFF